MKDRLKHNNSLRLFMLKIDLVLKVVITHKCMQISYQLII